MEIREATINDWNNLQDFYLRIYRENHPLQNKEFWIWQYGTEDQGKAFICIDEGRVVGHVGANFDGGLAWIINVYLDPAYRGKGIVRKLYELARTYYPLAATAANEAGLGLYRNMNWIRYYDLVRYVKVNPRIETISIDTVCKKVVVDEGAMKPCDKTHYFKQPGIKGYETKDKSFGVSQEEVGGFRLVAIGELNALETTLWDAGYQWVDYISSWNDPNNKMLEKNGWVLDHKSIVPWRLAPVEEGYFCDITFLSEDPLPVGFIVKRFYSDHGRIGSL